MAEDETQRSGNPVTTIAGFPLVFRPFSPLYSITGKRRMRACQQILRIHTYARCETRPMPLTDLRTAGLPL